MDIKGIIDKRRAQGKHLVKIQVLGVTEKLDVEVQLDTLGYGYEVYKLENGCLTPYDIIVEV